MPGEPSGNLPALPAGITEAEWTGYLGLIAQVPGWFREFALSSRCRQDGTVVTLQDQSLTHDGDSYLSAAICEGEEHHYVILVGFLKRAGVSLYDQAKQAVDLVDQFDSLYTFCVSCQQTRMKSFHLDRYYNGRGTFTARCANPKCRKAWSWEFAWVFQDPLRIGPPIEDEDFHSARTAIEALGRVDFKRDFRDVVDNYGG